MIINQFSPHFYTPHKQPVSFNGELGKPSQVNNADILEVKKKYEPDQKTKNKQKRDLIIGLLGLAGVAIAVRLGILGSKNPNIKDYWSF